MVALLFGCGNQEQTFEGQNGTKVKAEKKEATSQIDELPKELSMEFEIDRSEDNAISINLISDSVNQEITLEEETITKEVTRNQIERAPKVKSFVQGFSGNNKLDIFQQASAATGLIDILIVIDNSGSMSQEQQNLSTKLTTPVPKVQATSARDSSRQLIEVPKPSVTIE